MNRDEISLASLSYQGMIRELLKNWWMIVLAALSMWLLVSGIGKLLYVPQYSVSATLAVSAEGENNTYTSLTMANQMATVIKEIFESDALVSLVKEDVGTTSPASVSCSQVSETNLLVITVSSENPQDAYQFMNSALKHYDDVSDYVFSNAELRVLQEPSVPTAPANVPMLWNYRYFIGLAGGVMMAGMIILLYCFRHTVKTSKSAVKLLDGKIRGIIPFEEKKAPLRCQVVWQSGNGDVLYFRSGGCGTGHFQYALYGGTDYRLYAAGTDCGIYDLCLYSIRQDFFAALAFHGPQG